MYQIIFTYLIGIVVENLLHPDFVFLAFGFVFFLISRLLFIKTKRQVKDTGFLIKDIGKSTLIFLVFCLSTIYTAYVEETVSYKPVTNHLYNIEGSIESVKQQNETQTLMVRVENMLDLQTNTIENNSPEYVEVSVSPFYNYQLFDSINFVGEVEFKNFNKYYEIKPMFLSYEFMKLEDNVFYNVSQPKNISITQTKRNYYETCIIMFHNVSRNLKERIPQHMSEPYASVAQGISLGEQTNLLKDIKDIFKNSGLLHILVLSGANVAFVITLFWYFLKRLKNEKVKTFLAILFAWIFILLTGFTAPSVRAGVMASSNILSEYFNKNISVFYSLLFSLFVLTLWSPLTLLYSPSLHLSYLACVALFILAPKLEKYFHNFFLATFVSVFLLTTPYLLALTGSASLFGTLLTFLVEPFVITTTVLSFLIICPSFINFYFADLVGLVNTFSTKIIYSVAEFGAHHLPIINFQISKVELMAYYILVAVCIYYLEVQNDIIVKK